MMLITTANKHATPHGFTYSVPIEDRLDCGFISYFSGLSVTQYRKGINRHNIWDSETEVKRERQ